MDERLAAELVATVQGIRELELRKAPSIGETLDWAQALVVLGAPRLSPEVIEETLSVLPKYERDAERVIERLRSGEGPLGDTGGGPGLAAAEGGAAGDAAGHAHGGHSHAAAGHRH